MLEVWAQSSIPKNHTSKIRNYDRQFWLSSPSPLPPEMDLQLLQVPLPSKSSLVPSAPSAIASKPLHALPKPGIGGKAPRANSIPQKENISLKSAQLKPGALSSKQLANKIKADAAALSKLGNMVCFFMCETCIAQRTHDSFRTSSQGIPQARRERFCRRNQGHICTGSSCLFIK